MSVKWLHGAVQDTLPELSWRVLGRFLKQTMLMQIECRTADCSLYWAKVHAQNFILKAQALTRAKSWRKISLVTVVNHGHRVMMHLMQAYKDSDDRNYGKERY